MGKMVLKRGSVSVVPVLRLVGIGLLLVGHIVLVSRLLPVSFLASGEVPIMGDVSRYFASAYSVGSTGGAWGYDPNAMAGYTAGGWNSMGKKGYEIVHVLLPGVPLPALMSWYLFLALLLAPLLLWWAILRLADGKAGLVIPLAASLFFWHRDAQMDTFLSCGNVGFPLAAILTACALALLRNTVLGPRPILHGLGLGIVLSAIFYCHPVVVVPTVIGGVVWVGFHARALRCLPVWIGLTAGGVLCFLLALPWLTVLVGTRDAYQPLLYEGFMGSFRHLVMDVFSDRAYRRHFDRNGFLQLATVGAMLAAWLACRRKETSCRDLASFALSGLAILALAYVSHLFGPLRSWQPYRFLVPAMVLFLPGLCVTLREGIVAMRRADRSVRWVVVALVLVVLPRFTAYLVDVTFSRGHAGLPGDQKQVLQKMVGTHLQGRVVCDVAQVGHLLPSYCGKSVLGGLSYEGFVKEKFAGVDEEDRLFGRLAGEWTPGELEKYLDAYAAGYAIVAKPHWVALFRACNGKWEPDGEIGPFRLFRRTKWAGYTMPDGGADVEYDSGGITVRNIQVNDLILKFHYSSIMKASPGVRLTRQPILDDPVGFVRVQVPADQRECRISF